MGELKVINVEVDNRGKYDQNEQSLVARVMKCNMRNRCT